ncbi:GMC oxidoreductase [Roseiarcus fermentans]|uniref:GMC oxidoreductase n=1 Tax=Roseiarcus fermentans TaxID=1473586 RepID=UPI001FE0ACED|nr:GMC family oxidoreductase [Roseiarcus fermentans]
MNEWLGAWFRDDCEIGHGRKQGGALRRSTRIEQQRRPIRVEVELGEHYDVIVIGSGPGGASLAQALAPTGKRILILERGDYLPREEANWSAQAVFVDGRYQAAETWTNAEGGAFSPQLHYFVGGNSKVYGAALFRLRERDFDEIVHAGGVSPAWPLKYRDFARYYDAAEALFRVHGARGEDPTEPPADAPYPYPAVKHEPKVAELSDKLTAIGLKPFHLPLGILLDQKEDGFATPTSTCIRCTAFDGFPCLLNGKADAQVICIDPMLAKHDNVTLMTNAYVSKLGTDPSGRRVDAVHVERRGEHEIYSAATVVVACGSLSSALLLLRSANDRHPNGLANGSDQVGRNYMRHEMSIVMAVMRHVNETVFQKTLAFSDFYFGSDDWDFPLGLIQMCATSHADQVKGEALPGWLEGLPDMPFSEIARHSMDFWLQAEDLPRPDNRIYYKDGKVHLDLTETNPEALRRLKRKLKDVLSEIGWPAVLLERSLYLGKNIPLSGTAHQAGTCRFGVDPARSVLDLDCRAHEVDNLYVTDASFFPSIGAVNPTLTIIANALRVADIIKDRL